MIKCEYSSLLEIFNTIKEIANVLHIKIDHFYSAINQSNIIVSINKCVSQMLQLAQSQQITSTEQTDMYEQIEKELQKQENLNRTLIKKQLQFKEYQNTLVEQLGESKKNVKKMESQVAKINQQLHNREMQIMKLHNNQKRLNSKELKTKEVITIQTIVNQRKLDNSSKISHDLGQIISHNRRKSENFSKRPSTGQKKSINHVKK